MSTSTIQHGKVRVEITDKNGVKTHRWIGRQTQATVAATGRNGMIRQARPEYTRYPDKSTKEVLEGGRVVAEYPGLTDVQRSLDYVEIVLERKRRIQVKSNHDGPIFNAELGVGEFWLWGKQYPSRETWAAAKLVPPSRLIRWIEDDPDSTRVRFRLPEQERFADTGLPES